MKKRIPAIILMFALFLTTSYAANTYRKTIAVTSGVNVEFNNEAIVVTGQKAMDTLIATLPPVEEPKVGSYSRFTLSSRIFHLYRMPSSSRAYPKPLEEKAAVYKQMFEDLKMI